MKHIKQFENKKDKIYLVIDVEKNLKTQYFAFYDIDSRNNFIINYIHNKYKELYDDEYYNDIKDKFTIEELLKEFNIDDSHIELETVSILENIKLDSKLELRRDTNKFNI